MDAQAGDLYLQEWRGANPAQAREDLRRSRGKGGGTKPRFGPRTPWVIVSLTTTSNERRDDLVSNRQHYNPERPLTPRVQYRLAPLFRRTASSPLGQWVFDAEDPDIEG